MLINVPWGWAVPGGSKFWAWVSHFRILGLTPPVTPRSHKPCSTEDNTPRLVVKVILSSADYPVRLTPNASSISRKVSGSVVGSVGSCQSQI